MTERTEQGLLAEGLFDVVHEDDRDMVRAASRAGEPRELVFRISDGFGAWRQLEAHVSDLRAERQIRGIVFNARDVTEWLQLEQELSRLSFQAEDGIRDLTVTGVQTCALPI